MLAPLDNAIANLCRERELDPLGSVPLDALRRRPLLPRQQPEAREGLRRARQLLPQARALAIAILQRWNSNAAIPENRLQAAVRRVQAVTEIKPDVELHDNAMVNLKHPTYITCGTVFLVGLPSDEAMTAILVHELTHIANGLANDLQTVFQTLGRQAAQTGLPVTGNRAEELACDMAGTLAVRLMVKQTPSVELPSRRLARALGHNCVAHDIQAASHLSPQDTMRGVLALEPLLAQELLNTERSNYLPPSGFFDLTSLAATRAFRPQLRQLPD